MYGVNFDNGIIKIQNDIPVNETGLGALSYQSKNKSTQRSAVT